MDADLLSFVPQPVKAVLLLFPTTKERSIRNKEAEKNGEIVLDSRKGEEGDVMWIPQTVSGSLCPFRGPIIHDLDPDPPSTRGWIRSETLVEPWVFFMPLETLVLRSPQTLLCTPSSTRQEVSPHLQTISSCVEFFLITTDHRSSHPFRFQRSRQPLERNFSRPRRFSLERTRPLPQQVRLSLEKRITVPTFTLSPSFKEEGTFCLLLARCSSRRVV